MTLQINFDETRFLSSLSITTNSDCFSTGVFPEYRHEGCVLTPLLPFTIRVLLLHSFHLDHFSFNFSYPCFSVSWDTAKLSISDTQKFLFQSFHIIKKQNYEIRSHRVGNESYVFFSLFVLLKLYIMPYSSEFQVSN